MNAYPHCATAWEYANDVLDGTIPACRYIQLMCERFFRDVERDDLVFNYEEAERVCNFFEHLPHVKGKWAQSKEKLKLEPWQVFGFVNIFGFYRKATGKRRFNEVFKFIPRKNGKSIDAAAVGLYMAFRDNEFGAEVYCGATSERQANEVFSPATRMLKGNKSLMKFLGVEIQSKSIFRSEDNSFFQKVIGDPPDGTSPHCGIVDEHHEAKHDRVLKTFQTGMGARENPLLYVITTAGDNLSGPCFEKYEEAIQVLEGILTDEHADSLFVMIYTIDADASDDYWKTEEALRVANPNYDVSVSGDWLKKQQEQAIRSIKDQGYFKTKHLNLWVNQTEPFINYEDWKRCADPTLKIEDYAMHPCVMGIDLSSRIDFTATCKVFYEDDADGRRHYYLFPEFWLPESQRSEYESWRDYINFTEGNEIDTIHLKKRIRDDLQNYMVEEITFDPWKSAGIEQELDNYGAEITRFPQTIGQFTMPMNEFEAAIVAGRVHHADNPVLNWMLSNLQAKRDTNGNVKPRKEDKKKKIDGIVAAIMGIGRCMQTEDEDYSAELIII